MLHLLSPLTLTRAPDALRREGTFCPDPDPRPSPTDVAEGGFTQTAVAGSRSSSRCCRDHNRAYGPLRTSSFVVRAAFDDPAPVHHDDLAGVDDRDRRCAMTSVVRLAATSASSDWITRSVRESSADVASSRHQDRRVLQQRAGDCDPLLLPAGQLQAPLADQGPITVRQRLDEIVNMGHPRGRPRPRHGSHRAGRTRCCTRSCR